MTPTVRKRTSYMLEIREQAEVMRRSGKSYKEIFDKFAIPKSTLSTWFSEEIGSFMEDPKKRLAHLARIRKMSIAKFAERRQVREEVLEKKIGKLLSNFPSDLHTKRVMLAMLYWAEGAKTEKSGLTFANTDPLLCQLFIRLLRDCFSLDEQRIRIRLHLHYYHSIDETKIFWSKLLRVPTEQFQKIYVKRKHETKRFRKNFKGICFVRYGSETIRREIIKMGFRMAEKIVNMPSSFNG